MLCVCKGVWVCAHVRGALETVLGTGNRPTSFFTPLSTIFCNLHPLEVAAHQLPRITLCSDEVGFFLSSGCPIQPVRPRPFLFSKAA